MATSIATATSTEQQEQQLINELKPLIAGARKSSKEVGERLFKLLQLCKDKGERFNQHLKTLAIARSSAYNWIALYKQFVVEDYQFPANVVKFAGIAGISVSDLSHRATLYETLMQVGETPTDAQAISIVGSASSAIAAAQAKAKSTKPQLSPFEECIAAQDAAFVTIYKTLTKKTKVDTPGTRRSGRRVPESRSSVLQS